MKNYVKRAALAVLAAAGVLAGGVPAAGLMTSLAAAPADYSYLTSAYRARGTFLESRKDDNGRSMTGVIDCGDYYELTNVNFYVYRKYSTDEVEACVPGDIFRVNGRAYTVQSAGDGEYVLARTDSYGETTFEYLRRVEPGKNKQSYYIAEKRSSADGSFDSADLYSSGSAFFRKDALISVSPGKAAAAESQIPEAVLSEETAVRTGEELTEAAASQTEAPQPEEIASQTEATQPETTAFQAGGLIPEGTSAEEGSGTAAGVTVMTAEQYFTSGADARGPYFAGGWFPNEGYAKLCGTFTLDADGYITSYTEKE